MAPSCRLIWSVDAESLNRMLVSAVRDAASRRPAGSRDEMRLRAHDDRAVIARILGLDPEPTRDPINSEKLRETCLRDLRVQRHRFESRPGMTVYPTVYLPAGEGPFPFAVHAFGELDGPETAWAQARGAGLALYGIASIMVEAPGFRSRAGLGDPGDPRLSMGAPAAGVYAWDLIRAIDFAQGIPRLDSSRVALVGEGTACPAVAGAFILDPRCSCAGFVCWGASLATTQTPAPDPLPAMAQVGDRADLLAVRAPSPVLLIGAQDDLAHPTEQMAATAEKLRKAYELTDSAYRVRHETFPGGPDFNRRMRECVYAFLVEHLLQQPRQQYAPELRPMTDGRLNPAEAEDLPLDDPTLAQVGEESRVTFLDILGSGNATGNAHPFDTEERLIPWAKHGHIEPLEPGASLSIHDEDLRPEPAGSKRLPYQGMDRELCQFLGLSVAEVLAQVLHYRLPGRPEGWEPAGIGGDALTSIIASVKTLVDSANPAEQLKLLVAEGPVSSEVARLLRAYRPNLEIRPSHRWQTWSELAASSPALIMPLARYLSFEPSAKSQ